MKKNIAIFAGNVARTATKLRHTGGSALPGLVVEKIDKKFLSRIFANISVIVISGTNGKTTTTKIVTELLQSQGFSVFTNKTGSNFTRGIISEILPKLQHGKLPVDFAVLELDEAHAVRFVNQVQPDYSLLLNVLRDQLDRFGEIDTTAKFLKIVAEKTKKVIVSNANDPLVSNLGSVHFGYNKSLANLFPSDADLYGIKNHTKTPVSSVELIEFGSRIGYRIEHKICSTTLSLPGAHNALNAAAALALVHQILPKVGVASLIKTLQTIKPAFGRGESLIINGDKLDLILVKNPAGFRSALASQYNKKTASFIAINDAYADGRDPSWLWDIDFSSLSQVAILSGIRAYDMALRLNCQNIKIEKIEPDLIIALNNFLQIKGQKQIFCTYTAMLKIRKHLAKFTEMEKIL